MEGLLHVASLKVFGTAAPSSSPQKQGLEKMQVLYIEVEFAG